MQISELAYHLGKSTSEIKERLIELQFDGIEDIDDNTTLLDVAVSEVLESYGTDRSVLRSDGRTTRAAGWNAGAVKPVTHPYIKRGIERLQKKYEVASGHQEALAALGSHFVYAASCKIEGFESCQVALVRFSGAIESAFGLTREVLFFYSPFADFQIRTYNAARETLRSMDRPVTPDMIFFWSSDPRMRERLDDWSSGNFLPVPLDFSKNDDPVALMSLIKEYIFSRDLFYETTPVRGERFFGRRKLLQGLRDDVQNQRVAGLFGLRKAGKTSVLSQLSLDISDSKTIVVMRDLESLPSPPDDPIPDLLRDLVDNISDELKSRNYRTIDLARLPEEFGISDFRRSFQKVLRHLNPLGVKVILLLDEIEYLTPSDRIDIHEGNMPSVSQFFGALRSLVQENQNFTFMISGLTSSIVESGRLYGRPNPLFSWAKVHFLAPFEKAEADELAHSVGQKMGILFEDGALDALFEASGGHAFLYRQLASHVVEGISSDLNKRRIRRVDVLNSLEGWRQLVTGHIREMVDHVKRYYSDEAFLLEVLQEEPEEFVSIARDEAAAVGHLVKLGLIVKTDHEYELTPVLDFL